MESEIATRPGMALARPSFVKEGDLRGTENIGAGDIRPPALRIAQSGTPEAKASEPRYVEGLREGLMFNSLTKEIYGKGPMPIVVINSLGHRHVEFAPMSEGGGVVDFNVPDGDPRTEFTTIERDGKQVRQKPRATKFRDYLVLVLLEDGRRILSTLSFKSTQLKKAEDMNTIIKQAKLPSFALQFNVTPVPEKRGSYSFFGWRIDHTGFVGGNNPELAEEIYAEASAVYNSLAGKKVVVETEGTNEEKEDNPFDN